MCDKSNEWLTPYPTMSAEPRFSIAHRSCSQARMAQLVCKWATALKNSCGTFKIYRLVPGVPATSDCIFGGYAQVTPVTSIPSTTPILLVPLCMDIPWYSYGYMIFLPPMIMIPKKPGIMLPQTDHVGLTTCQLIFNRPYFILLDMELLRNQVLRFRLSWFKRLWL